MTAERDRVLIKLGAKQERASIVVRLRDNAKLYMNLQQPYTANALNALADALEGEK